MPYISVRTNVSVSPEQEKTLKTKLGEGIALLGKSEAWLMVEVGDNCRLWFKGDNAPAAVVEVKLLGKASRADYEKLTGAVCALLQKELAVNSSRVFVKYEEVEHWGWNGGMF